MALVLGTNCGFVTTAPTADPVGETVGQMDNSSRVIKDTSPSTAVKITEIGWWCNDATEESNFEVGLYAADGTVVPGEAGTRLFVSATNAKGTTAGWKVVSGLNWTISSSTAYWLAVQLDDTVTLTRTDIATTGGVGYDFRSVQTTLNDPYGGGALGDVDGLAATYAVWEAAGGGTVNSINIGDVWKVVSLTDSKINIGDVWKPIVWYSNNVGDAWKAVWGTP